MLHYITLRKTRKERMSAFFCFVQCFPTLTAQCSGTEQIWKPWSHECLPQWSLCTLLILSSFHPFPPVATYSVPFLPLPILPLVKHFLSVSLKWTAHPSIAPSQADFVNVSFLSTSMSINLFHFPNDLLLKDGQDGVIFAYLFKHHPKVIAYLLEKIPRVGWIENSWLLVQVHWKSLIYYAQNLHKIKNGLWNVVHKFSTLP